MMKCEFEKRIGGEISQEDYQVIETVYCCYPTRTGVIGDKDFYVNLYKTLGMRVFRDMYPLAKQIADTEDQILELQIQLQNLRKPLEGGD